MECFDPELEFISGRIFDLNLPKDKVYLHKYFTTTRQRIFVRYFLIYRSYAKFVDRTGYPCSRRWLKQLKKRLLALEDAKANAKSEGDFTTMASIESGNYKIVKA